MTVLHHRDAVSTHSRPKAAGSEWALAVEAPQFQHTAARRRLGARLSVRGYSIGVSTHSRPKAAGLKTVCKQTLINVSTHSRPKAAGFCHNTGIHRPWHVSTHSRPKAAGGYRTPRRNARIVSTHSRPKAAGMCCDNGKVQPYCFNTQPPEGGCVFGCVQPFVMVGFNTQPPEGGWFRILIKAAQSVRFQHTAARRRLGNHAGCERRSNACFNTQPPEGGWASAWLMTWSLQVSTHSRPKAAGLGAVSLLCLDTVSTHSRPKAAGFYKLPT